MKNEIIQSFKKAASGLCILAVAFLVFEPLTSAAIESQSVISQVVTAEIAFATPASNVSLSPSIPGLTGGTSNGGTQLVVTTNNRTGYTMTMTASSSLGMLGNSNPSNYIPAYVPASASIPDFAFTTPANAARFGYTVEASSTADLSTAFKDNGTTCGTGSADAANSCWYNASTTAFTIVNRTSNTPASGATTTLKFRVTINPNPTPVIPNDTYVATTTITATMN